MAYEIPVTQARAELAELINRVVYGGERVVVTRHGKPLVALVSAADLERLDAAGEAAAEAEAAGAEEEIISTVSRLGDGGTDASWNEPRRFGLTAEHGDPRVR
ncbi:type II toxin-antitoxin system Phd/YefM family antitoxin [Streptomyces sp. NPDC058374]|uniref:type II toxin-antitoxin system Phd/YefM family antitoxin n=1 Tax=unclassified Streptomyces TaxID=2593676 RepID=UPI003648F748